MSSGDLSGEAGSFVAPAGWDNSSGSPTGARKPPDTGASWGHWRGDGISSAGGDFPRPTSPLRESRRPTSPRPSSPASSMMSGASPASQRPSSMSPLDGAGYDRTAGCPPKEQGKVWSRRSMTKMSDYGTIPAALPLGLTDSEKKLWLALYVKAREVINEDIEEVSVRDAVHQAITLVTDRGSIEFRFAHRWQKSIMTAMAMRQDYRSSDVYS
mmetsp:Transcript_46399/g.121775  ORF Transcript_46399/g.121775 Transcript_46399/m.121775 type:complete len:213 (+) Transcript_46399:120-758(+)|eukprot:CAMPEP_0115847384 /NCGR_PEP_ID=MMETSP0287-20121206/10356_1 /TAXON_ID=412157 /ORGANISM="Chrysochromulina rotalis, Strain UIO044" /LENGTH=212 /DNA_ID=CAMNT_0003301219 /DNA_START=120 /DNA_END=758 /DNA_ORIENTATION=+